MKVSQLKISLDQYADFMPELNVNEECVRFYFFAYIFFMLWDYCSIVQILNLFLKKKVQQNLRNKKVYLYTFNFNSLDSNLC